MLALHIVLYHTRGFEQENITNESTVTQGAKLHMENSEQALQLRINEADTAKYTGMSRPWLRLQRMRGKGPAFIRIGRAIRYDIRDLDAWLQAHKVECR